MRIDDQIDDALERLPEWQPPREFTRRVAMAARPERHPLTLLPRGLFWIGAAFQGAAIALVAYIGSSMISAAATSLVLTLGMAFETYARSLSTFTL